MTFTVRSAQTRAAILTAARQRFAADGYDRTTIRAIAADAQIDPSMVIRYFGSKAELYGAVSDVDLEVPDLSGEADAGTRYARNMIDRFEKGDNLAEAILMRAAPTDPSAAARMQAIFASQIVPSLRAAYPDDPDIEQRAALVLSQTVGMVYVRYILKIEPLASMDRDEVADALARSIRRHLTAPLRPAGRRE
ncbi:MAG TPA: TetR family transcriptional regulator [Stackebrandtia sp.]|jgi:AcrR family transcriptional regulator|uniref:TetR/AcrR family transcriptional regulator n=1 Tax=Stackebrandtia sp. TaxID=2023065 RepID=UPI002D5C1294|nr:TetR family transcriptional regulator [Stackebrandtia sp.]HZE40349.1 TetR family transcriptional regulator [Stackebrandtia sp.]